MIMRVYYVILTLCSTFTSLPMWHFYDRENIKDEDVTSSIVFMEKEQKEIKV
jgi:hypothetical protein